jgi:MFS family permease
VRRPASAPASVIEVSSHPAAGRPPAGLDDDHRRRTGALSSPTFRRLTVAWVLSNFADSTLVLILAVWVTDLTDSTVAGGLTFAMLGIPALAAPFLGALADRVSRRRLLVGTYLAGALVLLPLLAVHDAGQVWLVYVVTVAYASIGYVTGAAQSGLLRDLLPDEALGPANARLSMIDQCFRVAMPFIGAGLYATVGPLPLVVVTAGTFAASATVLLFVRIAESVVPPESRLNPTELISGFRQVFHVWPLRPLTAVTTVAFAATGLVDGAVFAILDAIGIPRTWLPPILVLQGVGGVVASLVAPRLMDSWGRPRLVAAGLIHIALGLAPLPLGSVPLVIAAQLAVGLGTTAALIAYTTERTLSTPPALQGRTAAASQVLLGFPHVLLTGAGALLLTVLDWRGVVAVAVAVVLPCGVLCLLVRRRAPGRSSHRSRS